MKEIAEGQSQPIGRSLDEQRREFARGRFLAMPLAGLIAWTIIGVSGALLPPFPAVMVLFGAAGSIVYLGMFISRFTGEHFLDRSKPSNSFDRLFFHTIVMALLVFAIAIPFFQGDYTSLPLSVGHPDRPDVGAVLVDHRALDRHLPRRCADAAGDDGVVSVPGPPVRHDSGSHRGHLRRDDCRLGETLAREPPRRDRWTAGLAEAAQTSHALIRMTIGLARG
jgi:hypothetical protein